MNAIREESELPNIEKKLIECSDDITELFNMLMTLEMQLVEQLEVKPDWRGTGASACSCRASQACSHRLFPCMSSVTQWTCRRRLGR